MNLKEAMLKKKYRGKGEKESAPEVSPF